MTDKELIQMLRKNTIVLGGDVTIWDATKSESADRLEALIAENERLKAQTPHWVSVAERLPTDERPVLAYYGFDHAKDGRLGMMFIGTVSYFYFDREPHWQCADHNLVVTHWMPLPEPPSTEGVE